MKTFQAILKEHIQTLVGKNRSCDDGYIRITLKGGTKYWGTVKSAESDSFVIQVSHPSGGEEDIVMRFTDVSSFSLR